MKKCVFLLLMLFSLMVQADDKARQLLVDKLAQTYSIEAHFSQIVKSGGRIIDTSQGRFYLLKPGKFRLDITKPTTQLIVSDGKVLWLFDKDLEQVTKRALNKGLSNTPALFLSDTTATALSHYDVRSQKHNNQESFLLKPKAEDADYQSIDLFFRDQTLIGLSIKDNLDQITLLTLSKIKINPRLSSTLFSFKPPKGVDVVTE